MSEKKKLPKGCEALIYTNKQHNANAKRKETLEETGERYGFKKIEIKACEKATKEKKPCDRTASQKIEKIKQIISSKLKF